MRAILLAAGFGTRLRPLTDTTPKCLVPINGQPLLDIWLSRLNKAGVTNCLVNTHYLSEQVEKYLKGSCFREGVVLVYESELLGTAGTLIANADFFDGQDGLLVHADNYCLADFAEFSKAHINRPDGCLMTMMTFRTDKPSSCGIVETDGDGVVIGFHEKVQNPPGNLANGAVYLLSDDLISSMASRWPDAKDFSTEIIPHLMGKIFVYETREYFIDIGTPGTYETANEIAESLTL